MNLKYKTIIYLFTQTINTLFSLKLGLNCYFMDVMITYYNQDDYAQLGRNDLDE